MYALVGDVDSYAEFLPWCRRSEVVSQEGDVVEASLELEKGALSKSFTTRNTHCENERIDIALVGGPFRALSGGWQFDALGDDGCRVSLALDFEFESKMVDMLFGSFFEDTCNALVDAFTERAADVYGER
jgi:ribosome-associated toxin RatA of RatAB toxin-antitoxin module